MPYSVLLPYRTIAGFCLLISTGPFLSTQLGLGVSSELASVGLSAVVLLGLLLALVLETRQHSQLNAASGLAVLRTWSVLAIVVYVLNGHYGISGIGARMMRHFRTYELNKWWVDVVWVTAAIAVIEVSLGVLQFFADSRSATRR